MRWILTAALALVLIATAYLPRPLTAPLPETVYLEDMTWVEVRTALDRGKTVAIVPTGGVEQNGPHMVLGKHNHIVRVTAGRIARVLGNALVAPVVAYVPEGDIAPPTSHMAYPGTLSVPDAVFEAILEHTARSLKAHGFTAIVFVGDSYGNQVPQARVAERLGVEWAGDRITVLHAGDYYAANGQWDWLLSQGENEASIGKHAGIRDTSELMAVYPDGIRRDRLAPGGGRSSEVTGVSGDPTRASAERGETLLRLKIEAAVKQIRDALSAGS